MRFALLLPAVLLLNACAMQPFGGEREPAETREAIPSTVGSPTPPQSEPAPETPASSLLSAVEAAIAAGEFEQAAALCERALRISPRDGLLWYRLAGIRYRQERYGEAMGLARRAAVHAGDDRELAQGINRLLALTRSALSAGAE